MHLSTTGLTEFWGENDENLFLGDWCLQHKNGFRLGSVQYRILTSPWNDRVKFKQTGPYLDGVYENFLQRLSAYLNRIHSVSLSDRYWRILIGPWLFQYIHVLYDRFVHLKEAFNQFPELKTTALDPACYKTPVDTLQFIEFVTAVADGDIYNLQIYSQLIEIMGECSSITYLHASWPTASSHSSLMRRLARTAKNNILGRPIKHFLSSSQIGMYGMNVPLTTQLKLIWKMRFKTGLCMPRQRLQFVQAVFDGRRTGLSDLGGDSEFESILSLSLPKNFPIHYLEGFSQARSATNVMEQKIPNVLISSIGWYTDVKFQFIAAQAAESGKRLVAVQHGGGYGIAEYAISEDHEAAIADSYYVWGWADESEGLHQSLPSIKISPMIKKRAKSARLTRGGSVIFVSTTHPKYLHRFHSQPVVGQWYEYIGWELRFLGALPDELADSVKFRANQLDYGWDLKNRILDKFPNVEWADGLTFDKLLSTCKLAIIDNPSTTFLESLAADVPTVLFWDPDLWDIRTEARSYFESLRDVGILHDSPESAAELVSRIWDDPLRWWSDADIQSARRKFASRYALAKNNWADYWASALEKELSILDATSKN